MDRVTQSLVEDFSKSEELSANSVETLFEHFCNFSILQSLYSKDFDVVSLFTGDGDELGIDGFALILNGTLIQQVEEIEEIAKNNENIEANFIFVQAKTSKNFAAKEIGAFLDGVQDFFDSDLKRPLNEEIRNFVEFQETLYKYAAKFRENPSLKLYYVTTGNVNNIKTDEHIQTRVRNHKDDLNDLVLFGEIEINLLGASEIGQLYRKSKNPVSAEFVFSNKVTLPEIKGVEISYFGILPFSEFKKLLADGGGNFLGVFEDNVRDFQGFSNPVNSEISNTLTGENPSLFSVLNNGVTIVADKIKTTGNKVMLIDYQIVNGCQTSHVLYEHRHKKEIADVQIPIRIIVTKDDSVKSEITVSTNNQTQVKKDQLFAMTNFQKELEHYYLARSKDLDLRFERRAKQYNSDSSVSNAKVISIANQLKSFSSMFLKNPHIVTTYYGQVINSVKEPRSGICDEGHQLVPYYMAGVAYYRLDSLFRSGEIDKKYRKVKFYLLMLALNFAEEGTRIKKIEFNSDKKVEKYCEPIITKFMDHDQSLEIFRQAVDVIDKSGADIEDKQSLKSRAMTEQILNAYEQLYMSPAL